MNDSDAAASWTRSKLRQQRLAQIENEQMIEEREALRMTEEQHRTLLDSFKGVKTVFSDLDGLSWSRESKRYPPAPAPRRFNNNQNKQNHHKLPHKLSLPLQTFQVLTNDLRLSPVGDSASTIRATPPPLSRNNSSSTIRASVFVPERVLESRRERRASAEGVFPKNYIKSNQKDYGSDDEYNDGDRTFRAEDLPIEEDWDKTVAWGRGRTRTPLIRVEASNA